MEIVQIAPASNWHAVFLEESGEVAYRLAVWALCTDGNVHGLDAELLEPCDTSKNFVGYKWIADE